MSAPEPSADVQPGHDGVCRVDHGPGTPHVHKHSPVRPAAPSEPTVGSAPPPTPYDPATGKPWAEPPAKAQRDDDPLNFATCQGHHADPAATIPGCHCAARPSADTETLRDALRLIAGPAPHCSTSTTERHACRQPDSGRTRGARYDADAWCDQCIAYAALDGAS